MNLFNSGKKSAEDASAQQLSVLQQQNTEAISYIRGIAQGNLDLTLSDSLVASPLGASLIEMRRYLAEIASEEKKRSWLNEGLARFSDILRNKKSLSLGSLSEEILFNIVKYVGANQGSIFVLEEHDDDRYLNMIACYAYDRKRHVEKRVEIGNGLVGQCFLEKEPIYLTQTPENYVNITSGLGEATPRCVLICPLIINESVFGIIELASFVLFEDHHREFIHRISENIAATIKTVKDNEKTLQLLSSSQEQSEALRSQEEEMRQNMEELTATQEEMERKALELTKTSAEMKGLLGGINATMAAIEFTPDGTILGANNNFLKAVGYDNEQITGKHHRIFVPADILASESYSLFWKSLAAGKSNTGIFKRVSASGKTVWLNAIYNPITNNDGVVIKVIKYATDITAQQELLAESKGMLAGIDATMATIVFTPDGTILEANKNFLEVMGYKLSDIVGKHHSMFADRDITESEAYKTFWSGLAGGHSVNGIFRRVSSNGKSVWLDAIYNPIRNAEGKVEKVIKFATDVTREQEMTAETNGLLKGIDTTMATIEFRPDGTIITANPNFLTTMGYTLDQIRGKHHRMFAPKDIVNTESYQEFWPNLAAGQSLNGIFKRVSATGKTVWLNASYNPIFNADGHVDKVIKFAIDVTDQQEMMAESRGIMDGINARMATIEFLPDGTVVTANPNFLKTMGYDLHQIKGKHHRVFVPEDMLGDDYKLFWKRMASGESMTGIFKRKSASGDTVWLNAIYNPIRNAEGRVVKVVKFATDVTQEQSVDRHEFAM